jgi:hypothetical protein
VILSDGYNNGQKNGLNLLDYLQVAHIYNYLNDYEIQIDENIKQGDILRAIQEGVLPSWFTSQIANYIF